MAVRPTYLLRPRSGWQSLDLMELWRFRDLLIQLGVRDVKLRYRQTAMGVAWVLIQPIVTAMVFAFLFGRVARLSTNNIPPFWFAFTGLIAWGFFQGIVSRASASLVQSSPIISKVYFPRLVLPLATIISCLLDFAVGLVIMLIGLVGIGLIPDVRVLLLPVWLLLFLLLAAGVGMYSAAITARYRDLQYALPFVIQFFAYASPVGYATNSVPPDLRGWYALNPLVGLLEAFRWSILGTANFSWAATGYASVISVCVFVFGMYGFRRVERSLADVL